jgi:hypothetical protein
MGRAYRMLREMRNPHKILAGKSETKGPLKKAKYIKNDNIKMNHNEIGLEGVDWISIAQVSDQCGLL